MGPYYDAVSLMIWRLPEPERTPWAAYREPAVRHRLPRRLFRIGGRSPDRPASTP